ncbi:hypothetical protein BTA35_0211725 [Oceanospirillum linum]|uniref:CBU-0592-like domain-containing protein n=2 Tax=Oceanospirillum linum TaxID=966 RepID=A0A1T1H9N6_OCELI|nr:hypothetical protein BTA35_0211725 [Oceanospirillum linum]SEG29553.1 hypothetical protein SAMN04489856_107194 [Oleiphilus messinensis]SMP26284.1 hypothetical protein SAMN06264348_10615 [Oceanospirillum linum]
MSYTWFDLIGNIGVFMVVLAFYLLQTERLYSRDIRYSLLNLTGAILLLISLLFNWNLSSVIIEFFWIGISLIGIFKHLTRKSNVIDDSGEVA